VVPGDPEVILDTAHNPASARALIAALAERPPAARRTLIVSISSDKDVRAVVAELVPHFERIIVTQYQENPRAVPADALMRIVGEWLQVDELRQPEVLTTTTPAKAWELATHSAMPGERICIAGSFFLAAELRPLVLKAQTGEVSEPVIR
jgi:dihydrofolate synthase/folylpolyglutamate synthase